MKYFVKLAGNSLQNATEVFNRVSTKRDKLDKLKMSIDSMRSTLRVRSKAFSPHFPNDTTKRNPVVHKARQVKYTKWNKNVDKRKNTVSAEYSKALNDLEAVTPASAKTTTPNKTTWIGGSHFTRGTG